jgi:hypothetical protein
MNLAPKHEPDPHEQLARFVARMREAAPFGPVDWDAAMWDLTGRLTRAGKRLHISTRDALWFSQLQSGKDDPRVPFGPFFDGFAKAVICNRHLRSAQTVGAHRVSLRALRYIEAVMRREGLVDITHLEGRHFRDAEARASNREKPSSAYRVAQRLEEISNIIDRGDIGNIRIQYRSSVRKSAVEAIATKMPGAASLEVLGDVSASRELYDNKADLILMRAVDILAGTGFRIGEALSLPENPIVERPDGIALRYWPEKGGEIRIKQISSAHRELIERAVKDLTEACSEARGVALWCEEHPGRAPLPDALPEILSTRDIERMGLVANAVQWLKQNKVPISVEGRTWMVHRFDLEKALANLRDDRPLLTTGDGRVQSLGNSLIVVFKNELHAERATNRFVATCVSQGQIADFLGARDECFGQTSKSGSVFKRRDLRAANGRYHRFTTHQFRHWLSTLAKRGGLSDVELARWMGRKRIADNRAYDHRTQEERVEEARALIRSGNAVGPLAEAYRSLPPADAETFLRAQLGSSLNTPYGMCVHDYGQGPCERHFACAGCGELVRRKGDVEERAALSTCLERTQKSLAAAKAEETDGTLGAPNWVARNERLVVDLISLLAVDDNPEIADGNSVRVWPNNPSKAEGFDAA